VILGATFLYFKEVLLCLYSLFYLFLISVYQCESVSDIFWFSSLFELKGNELKGSNLFFSVLPHADFYQLQQEHLSAEGGEVAPGFIKTERAPGEIPLDLDFIGQLEKHNLQTIPPVHQHEHSVQIELPLLQFGLGDDFSPGACRCGPTSPPPLPVARGQLSRQYRCH